MGETFDWVKPSILWRAGSADMLQREFFRPTLHGFNTDKFMDEFLASASAPGPAGFRDSLARPAQFEPRPTTAQTAAPLKLFQPVHGCFYLTSASLCCRIPGFPDREVKPGDGENVFFVLRKKLNGVEYAWTAGEAGKGWKALNGQAASVAEDEERLPLAPTQTAKGRTIFFGYVPVSSQDTFAAAPTDLPAEFQEDQRLYELDARFIGSLADSTLFGPNPANLAPQNTQLRISVYLFLDLWEYFDLYLPEVALALRDGTTSSLTGASRDLAVYLQNKKLKPSLLAMSDALAKVAGQQSQLNEPGDSDLAQLGYTNDYNLHDNPLTGLTDPGDLRERVAAALAATPGTAPAPVPVPKFPAEAGDRYVLRCVYERAQCVPAHLYVSRPSEEFELAPFFDPDAPGRPVRVGLPVDVSLSGLRKFKKNVAFMMSNQLRKKIDGIAGKEKDILDNNASVSDGGIDIGLICSFSIPIITLCAFILLFIIVILLNIVFWWIPLLKICFPLGLSISKK